MSDGKVVFDVTGNLSGINASLNQATNTIAQQTAKWTVLGQTAMNGLVASARTAFNGIKALWDNAYEYNSSMQSYEVNFKTLLGSAEAAQLKMVELKQYAAKTPFAFSDLADATQTMLAFDMTAEESALALKHLGDISLGDANKLKSLTLAFSQVSSTGKLMGQDLLQMINAGFNPLKVIAEETGVAYADLKAVMSGDKTSEDFQIRMEAARREVEELGVNASQSAIMLAQIGEDGMISADMVAAAMRIATAEGGMFYKALENASTTAQGQISTIKDSWDMLAGKVTGGVFDQLSTNVLPKVITWLDELNAAYDKDGWAGLKGVAGGIFDEIGTLAFNAGAGLLTQIYNGLTGDTKTTEEVKAYLAEIFGVASEAVASIKDVGVGVLEWIRDNGTLVGAAATLIGGGFAVMTLAANPLAAAVAAVAGAIALLTTDWTTFEAKYPQLVATFESLTGLDFTTVSSSLNSFKTNVTAFYNDAVKPVLDGFSSLLGTGEGASLGQILYKAWDIGSEFGGGWLIKHWTDVKKAVLNAYGACQTFFTQTVPEGWSTFCQSVGQFWSENVCSPIDKAALVIADMLGIQVPENWSLCESMGAAWQKVLDIVNDLIKAVRTLLGLNQEDPQQEYIEALTAEQESESEQRSPSKYAGKYAHLAEDVRDEMMDYVAQAIEQGSQKGLRIDTDIVPSELFQSLSADIYDAMNSGELTIEIAETWFEDAEDDLQEELDAIDLRADVHAQLKLDSYQLPSFGTVGKLLAGLTGTSHAAGGIFSSATRFLQDDGMHTIGESSPEALLPLDTLWRKMGLIFDKTFAANLDNLRYNIMPPMPAATSSHASDEDLSERIAVSVREAVSGLTVELDKRKVGKILLPGMSRDMADDISNRRWTG